VDEGRRHGLQRRAALTALGGHAGQQQRAGDDRKKHFYQLLQK